jgi:hypothetical protein
VPGNQSPPVATTGFGDDGEASRVVKVIDDDEGTCCVAFPKSNDCLRTLFDCLQCTTSNIYQYWQLLHTSHVHCFTEAGDCLSIHRSIQYTHTSPNTRLTLCCPHRKPTWRTRKLRARRTRKPRFGSRTCPRLTRNKIRTRSTTS